MSLSSILSVARTAMAAQQAATQIASHNIANVNTEGYSAQRAELGALTPQRINGYNIGTGVGIIDVTRNRDAFLDANFRQESSLASSWSTRKDLLGRIESIYGEPSDNGLSSQMDAFFSAWSDLADHPTNDAARVALQGTAQQLASSLNGRSDQLNQMKDAALARLDSSVKQLNDLTAKAADLNRQITSAQSDGKSAADLSDSLDRVLDEMSKIVPITIIGHPNGGVTVSADGIALVDGSFGQTMSVQNNAGVYSLVTAAGTKVSAPTGVTGGLLDAVNKDIPANIAELDRLAQAMVTGVNGLHTTAMNRYGQTGLKFFDDRGDVTTVTASNFRLSSDIDDATRIGTSAPGVDALGNPVYRAGSNDVAGAIAGLRDSTDPTRLDGKTFGVYYSGVVATVGVQSANAKDAADIHQTLSEQAETQRQSVSGVSTDEELTRLMQAQSAYAAAARVINTAEQMMQDLLGLIR